MAIGRSPRCDRESSRWPAVTDMPYENVSVATARNYETTIVLVLYALLVDTWTTRRRGGGGS